MKKSAKKLTKGAIAAIATISAAATLVCALFIINIYFPLKYVSAYFVSAERSPSDAIYFHFLDVGQADCAIAELPDGKVMLIDGGDGAYSNTLKIIKELNKLDVDTIDYLVCTSVNAEHCGGLAEIINTKQVSIIYYPYTANMYITDEYYDFYVAAKASGAQMVISEYGAGAEGSEGDTEYFFTFLSPSVHTNLVGEYQTMAADPSDENINNASAVLWIEIGGKGIFYAGDVQSAVLDSIAENYSFYLQGGLGSCYVYGGREIDFSKCVLYKAANHGNYDSLSTALCELLAPEYSVISAGENNAEGCPSVYVTADLSTYGEPYITMIAGDITFTISGGKTAVS